MGILTDLKGTINSTFSIGGRNVVWVPVRQTVLSGRVDTTASNRPGNALSGSSLTVTLNASSSDVCRFTIADGFGSNGQQDYVGEFTSNQTLTVAASTTSYVYVNRSTVGALSLGSSALTPSYGVVAPSSPSTDQHWFDLLEFKMKRWSGSAWVAMQRVFVGECTATTSITSTTTYAYMGCYVSEWRSMNGGTTSNFNHNLGIYLSAANAAITLYTNSTASDVGAFRNTELMFYSTTAYGFQYTTNTSPNMRLALELSSMSFPYTSSTGWQAAGYAKVIVQRGW